MKKYTDTDQRLQVLSQVIAKANRTYVPKKEDDSHTNLYFDSLGDRIMGRWIEIKNDKILFTLNLSSLDFEVVNSAQYVLVSVPSIGHKIGEIEIEIERHLADLELSATGFREKLHYEIPEYSFLSQPVSVIGIDAMAEWKHFRSLANEGCALLMGHAQRTEETRIWPHHFDTGIYINIKPNLGLGFGLAMEDEMVGAPYFYMSGYSSNGKINYDNLPKGKDWEWKIGENWNGAVLPLSNLGGKTDVEQKDILGNYLRVAFKWFAKRP